MQAATQLVSNGLVYVNKQPQSSIAKIGITVPTIARTCAPIIVHPKALVRQTEGRRRQRRGGGVVWLTLFHSLMAGSKCNPCS